MMKASALALNPQAGLMAARCIEIYVFPNGELPHRRLARQDMQGAGLEPLDAKCLRRHDARTQSCWSDNFASHRPVSRSLVDATIHRIWRVDLAGCAHAFVQNWMSVYPVLACKAETSRQFNPTLVAWLEVCLSHAMTRQAE